MVGQDRQSDHLSIEVSNIGGIDERRVEFSPGVTVLVGENATNRTSLLQALSAALGSDRATLRGNAESGKVTLTIGTDTYTRTLRRQRDHVRFGGDPYLDDCTVADLYAFLQEDNTVRRAVEAMGRNVDDALETGRTLYDILMDPVDEAAIQRQIAELQDRRKTCREQLAELSKLAEEVPQLEAKRRTLGAELEECRKRKNELQADLEALEAKHEERAESSELDGLLDEKDDLRDDLAVLERKTEQKERELSGVETELDSISVDDVDEAEIEARIDEKSQQLRARRQQIETLETARDEIDPVIDAHRRLKNGPLQANRVLDRTDIPATVLSDGPLTGVQTGSAVSQQNPTAQLIEDDEEIVCAVCGSHVRSETLEALGRQLDDLQTELADQIDALEDEVAAIRAEHDELQSRLQTYRESTERRQTLQQKRERLLSELEDLRAEKTTLDDQLDELRTKIDERQAEGTTDDLQDEFVELRTELNTIRSDIRSTEAELEAVETELDEKTDRLDERDDLQQEIDDIDEQLDDLRRRVDVVEDELVESFNHHMERLLDRLEFDDIARIWIEKRREEPDRGRDRATTFELHVVRDDGDAVYEDTVRHLSESQREVAGLIVALTGYLVHDVYETMPIMILDSVEMIDSKRLARLLDYISEHTDYLIAALLPSHTEHLERVDAPLTEIDW